jgi:dienelactone hydrolase
MRLILIALMFMLLAVAAANRAVAQDDLIEETGLLRVAIGDKVVRLEAMTVKRAGTTGRLPVALIAHGKTGTQASMSDQHTKDYAGQARDLARRGYLAVVVMRRGFGRSDGPLPVDLSCLSTSFLERLESDADDLSATLHSISLRPDADASHIIVIGESTGGVDALALSARNPPGLIAVVNVSGGMRFDECPKEEELVAAFRAFGARSRIPSLWIYASNDSFFRPELVERMRLAFVAGGGDAHLAMLEPDGRDGHALFATPTGRAKWLAELDGLLRAQKLPTWTDADVNALMQKLGVKETARHFVEHYIAAPSEKALAREKGGSYIGEGYGGPTMENARQSAMGFCLKVKPACEIIIENDHWLGPERQVAEPPPARAP